MGANGLRCSGFTVGAPRIALNHPIVLLVSAGHQPGQPAPLGFDVFSVAIDRSPGPVRGAEHADAASSSCPRPSLRSAGWET
jgi:hypothetical protein